MYQFILLIVLAASQTLLVAIFILHQREDRRSKLMDRYHTVSFNALMLLRFQEVINLILEKDKAAQRGAAKQILPELEQLFKIAISQKELLKPIYDKITKHYVKPEVTPRTTEVKLSEIIQRHDDKISPDNNRTANEGSGKENKVA